MNNYADDLLDIQLNINKEGFGPQLGSIFNEYEEKLFKPYNALEKVGKISDFFSAYVSTTVAKPQKTEDQGNDQEKDFEVIDDDSKKIVKASQG